MIVTQLVFWLWFLDYTRIEVFKYLLAHNERTFRKITCGKVDIQEFKRKHMTTRMQDEEKENRPRVYEVQDSSEVEPSEITESRDRTTITGTG
jgi:hypothetical protein